MKDKIELIRKMFFFVLIDKANLQEQCLLIRYFAFGETLRQIAKTDGVSFQAVFQRIRRAAGSTNTDIELLRCIGLHWQELRIYGNQFHLQNSCRTK